MTNGALLVTIFMLNKNCKVLSLLRKMKKGIGVRFPGELVAVTDERRFIMSLFFMGRRSGALESQVGILVLQ